MDLTSFINNVEKRIYKVTFLLAESKIKRFITASSKENATYLVEQDVKKENPKEKLKIIAVEDLAKKQQENGLNV